MYNNGTPPTKQSGTINSNQPINWSAHNLQDIQTMEVLKDMVEKHGSLAVMLHLEKLK